MKNYTVTNIQGAALLFFRPGKYKSAIDKLNLKNENSSYIWLLNKLTFLVRINVINLEHQSGAPI